MRSAIGPATPLRLTVETIGRIEAFGEQLRAEHPGMQWNRSDVLRHLIELGLQKVERKKR
jgi:hypothetical protein